MWFDPLVTKKWPGYFVKFPGLSRRVGIPYETISSESLREATVRLAGGTAGRQSLEIVYGEPCEIVSPTGVKIGGSCRLDGPAVIDCRGCMASAAALKSVGYQSFIGHEYETSRGWPMAEPTLMDVRADQACGFEFLYELPFGPDRVLLEYTRFSEEPVCSADRAERLIATRLAEAGVDAAKLVRTERGCLPMPYAAAPGTERMSVAGGYAGGWYHAATGYSMPLAVRFADLVAKAAPEHIAAELAAVASRDALRRGFARFLNRLLFCLVQPTDRWKVFRRFYQVLSEDRISRFYAHQFNVADAARIVIGRPPAGLAPIRFAKSFFPRTGPGLT